MNSFLAKIPIVEFVQHYCKFLNRRFILLNLISGLSSTTIVALVNNSASSNTASFDLSSFLIFAIVLVAYIYTTKTLMDITFEVTEDSVDRVRQSLFKKLRLCDLEFFEQKGKEQVYSQIMKSTAIIAQTGAFILATGPELILIVLVYIYIFFLSKIAFLICISMLTVAATIFVRRTAEVEACYQEAAEHDKQVGGNLNGLLFGFKECLLNSRRILDLSASFFRTSGNLAESRIDAGKNFSNSYAFVQIFFYVLIAIIVFIMPVFTQGYFGQSNMTFKLVAAIFFVFIPTANLVRTLNYNTQVSVAIQGIWDLDRAIDKRLQENGIDVEGDKSEEVLNPPTFETLTMDGIFYSYYDSDHMSTFSAGPFTFELKKGEVVFICGGNGSGKTTFLKLLTGLYKPERGIIKQDGTTVLFKYNNAYREIFAAIFSDFYIFQKLYGLFETDPAQTAELLALFHLEHKTKREGDSFTNIELSTGQRKRLALIIALMEDKPVYIFDEWAADQDPIFREYFYLELIPRLKQEGKTIIAVSHDDRYYHCSDRVLHFQDGKIDKEIVNSENSPQ